jgi:hypothetical protein
MAALVLASCGAAGPGAEQSVQPAGVAPAGSGPLTVTIGRAEYGLISARTAAGATCTASARLPSGRESSAQGLDTHAADGSGSITWTYRTEANTTKGTGTYTVSCSAGGQTARATASFTVR